MAKKQYAFSIEAAPAKFEGGFAQINLSDMVSGKEIAKIAFDGTLAEAIELRGVAAKQQNVDSVWWIRMRNRNDRKAPGLKDVRELYWEVAVDGAKVAA